MIRTLIWTAVLTGGAIVVGRWLNDVCRFLDEEAAREQEMNEWP